MNARALRLSEMEKVREMSKKYFPDLEVPDFMNGYYCAYAITDDKDELIIAGGLRPSAEILQVTDLNRTRMEVYRALLESRKVALYLGNQFHLNELLVFVQNLDTYTKHLTKYGFYPRSNVLAIKVPKWDSHNATKT